MKIVWKKEATEILTPLFCDGTPPGLIPGPKGPANQACWLRASHLHTKKCAESAVSSSIILFSLLHILPSPLHDLKRCHSVQCRFTIVSHFINMGNILGVDLIANFYPNTPCKKTSLKFIQLVIKWFLYIPRLLYSPNCFNK